MTPQELDNLRDRARLTNTFSAFDIAALLDYIEAQEEALRRCHELLSATVALIDPEVHEELAVKVWKELMPCDESGMCPEVKR